MAGLGGTGRDWAFLTGRAGRGRRGQGRRTVCGYSGPRVKASSKGLPQGSLEGVFWGTGLNQLISALGGDCRAYKTPSIYYLALYRKHLPAPVLE